MISDGILDYLDDFFLPFFFPGFGEDRKSSSQIHDAGNSEIMADGTRYRDRPGRDTPKDEIHPSFSHPSLPTDTATDFKNRSKSASPNRLKRCSRHRRRLEVHAQHEP